MKQLNYFLIAGLYFFIAIGSSATSNPDQEQINQWINNDVGFEQNYGQIKDLNGEAVQDVLFSAKLQDYSLFITKDGVSVVMYQFKENDNPKILSHDLQQEHETVEVSYARYDLNLVNGIIDKDKIILEEPIQGTTNYYLGDTKATHVKAYKLVTLKDVYPGIDWVWRFDGEMHHEFVVQSGADPSVIRLDVKWADVEIEDNGKTISYITPLGKITDGPLYAYEQAGKNEVNIQYRKLENNHVSFNIANYNKDEVLVIDPPLALQWSTFYGGEDADRGNSIVKDAAGSIFITGQTSSVNFPTQNLGGDAYFDGVFNGDPDTFVLKFTNSGVLEWATYYGGANHDYGESITIDISGNVFIAGQTNSPNLPTQDPGGGAYFDDTTNGQSDAFILKFTNDGILEWGTYYGGNKSETGFSINTDYLGNVFVIGKTRSLNFPIMIPEGDTYFDGTPNGNYDIFILKFTNSGVREWGTFYGGESVDWGESSVIDASGNLFVMGRTESTNLPTQDPGNGAYFVDTNTGSVDSFILKFTDSGVLEWATYYGGSDNDWIHAATVDDSGNLYITGETLSDNMPTLDQGGGAYFQDVSNGSYEAFILKFTGSGVPLWATYYGGAAFDYGISMTTDDDGSLFILGSTSSSDFPLLDPGDGTYFDDTYHGYYDMFLLEFNSEGKRQWATYFGGEDYDFAQSLVLDGIGGMFVTGSTLSADFPTLDPGNGAFFDDTYNSPDFHDLVIVKFYSDITNIEEEESQLFDEIVVYPNPSQGLVHVNLGELQNVNIKVFDIIGSEIFHIANINTSEYDFNLEESAGVYFVEINAANKSQRYKLVIK